MRNPVGLRFVRQIKLGENAGPPKARAGMLLGCEILGFGMTESGMATRLFYVCTDVEGDGCQEFAPDQYGGYPIDPQSIYPGKDALPPGDLHSSTDVMKSEAEQRQPIVLHWSSYRIARAAIEREDEAAQQCAEEEAAQQLAANEAAKAVQAIVTTISKPRSYWQRLWS